MPKTFLITKLKTTNVGNQALSEELIRLFKKHVGEDQLVVDGRPMGLDSYSESRIKSSADPVKAFEKWVDAILGKFQGVPAVAFRPHIPGVTLLSGGHEQLKFEKIKARLRPLKRLLSRVKAYNTKYEKRLQRIQSCDWVVYSGAGEVGDNNVFLRQLIELRVAQKLGKKTAAVNQSVVIKTPAYQKLVALVYNNMDRIVVRGEISKRNLISYGVRADIFQLAPDTALNTPYRAGSDYLRKEEFKKPVAGINFTPRVKLNYDQLSAIVEKLRKSGRDIVFVTNEPFEDGPVALELQQRYQIPALKNDYDYLQYCGVLGELEFLISTRLHSNVLALVAKTPVIAIEGNVFKTTELMAQVKYPVPVIDPAAESWLENVNREIDNITAGKYDFPAYFEKTLPGQKEMVENNASWMKTV